MSTPTTSAEAKAKEYKEASLAAAKERLIKVASEGGTAEQIMSEALQVSYCEGALEAATLVADAVEGGATKEEAAAYLTGVVLNGPGDTWSGRGNDGRRSRYEGMLSVLKKYTRGY